jgi:hypothetical protein
VLSNSHSDKIFNLWLQRQYRRYLLDPSDLSYLQGFKIMFNDPDLFLKEVLGKRAFLRFVEVDGRWRLDVDLNDDFLWSLVRRLYTDDRKEAFELFFCWKRFESVESTIAVFHLEGDVAVSLNDCLYQRSYSSVAFKRSLSICTFNCEFGPENLFVLILFAIVSPII